MLALLKWAGGKSKLAPVIDAAFRGPCEGTYFEPFCGGASVYLHRRRQGTIGRAVLSDANPRLIAFYRAIQSDVDGVLKALGRLPELQGQGWPDTYYEVRATFNDGGPDGPDQAARLLWLNRGGYNGLYRENRSGGFNVPVGRNRAMRLPPSARLTELSGLLQGATLVAASFEQVLAGAGAGDQVYCDPPYVPLGGDASFTAYHGGDFGSDAQRALVDAVRSAAGRGAVVVLSNHDLPSVRRELYARDQGFQIVHELAVARSIGRGAESRVRVGELVARIGPDTVSRGPAA
jgi:DNA adenine methylase